MKQQRNAEIIRLYENTLLTLEDIGKAVGCGRKVVHTVIAKAFTKDIRNARKKRTYRNSKLGSLNPMQGKNGVDHHNYKGRVDDGNGYYLVLKPGWYTGRVGSKHVFEHSVVICKELGLTAVPVNSVVHHVNGDTHDNRVENLQLISASEHMKIHNAKKRNDYPKGVGCECPRSA